MGLPKCLAPFRRQLTCLLLPIVLLPLPLWIGGKEMTCGYVVLIMAYLWVTETLPLAITSLIPVVAFPLLGVQSANEISRAYLPDANFVFFGSMVCAVAVESTRLHERIALKTILLAGPNPRWLMLGFIIATCFLSMWISNTACTMMMVPIVTAVIKELDTCRRRQSDPEQACRFPAPIETVGQNSEEIVDLDEVPEDQLRVYKGLLLCICFAASIGGTGTLIGTGPNIVLNAFLNNAYGADNPVTFASFMLYALPQTLILIVVCWLWLQALFIGFRTSERTHDGLVDRMLRKKYDALGPIHYREKTMVVVFTLIFVLWMTRRAWTAFLPHGHYVTDGTVAMFVALLLFILPTENPFAPQQDSRGVGLKKTPTEKTFYSSGNSSSASSTDMNLNDASSSRDKKDQAAVPTIMTWPLMRDKFSWSTLMLLGGGFAMAAAVERSGLSDYIGSQLSLIDFLPEFVFIAMACLLTTFLTEFSSNVATASIFIPMVASIAKRRGTDPLVYVLPVTLASSYAFMFPAGTPPNAIVFAVKILRVKDMVVGGAALNFAAFFVSQLMTYTYGHWVFNFESSSGGDGGQSLIGTSSTNVTLMN